MIYYFVPLNGVPTFHFNTMYKHNFYCRMSSSLDSDRSLVRIYEITQLWDNIEIINFNDVAHRINNPKSLPLPTITVFQ